MGSEAKWRKMHAGLVATVNRKHPDWSQERKDAYVYGAKRKAGWKPKREKKG
jgi:hypothetical protein